MKAAAVSLLFFSGFSYAIASDAGLELPPLTFKDTDPARGRVAPIPAPTPAVQLQPGIVMIKPPLKGSKRPGEQGFVFEPRSDVDYKLIVVAAPNVDPEMVFPRQSRSLGKGRSVSRK